MAFHYSSRRKQKYPAWPSPLQKVFTVLSTGSVIIDSPTLSISLSLPAFLIPHAHTLPTHTQAVFLLSSLRGSDWVCMCDLCVIQGKNRGLEPGFTT